MRTHLRDCRKFSPAAHGGAYWGNSGDERRRPPRPRIGARVSAASLSLALDELDAAQRRHRHIETKALVGPPGPAGADQSSWLQGGVPRDPNRGGKALISERSAPQDRCVRRGLAHSDPGCGIVATDGDRRTATRSTATQGPHGNLGDQFVDRDEYPDVVAACLKMDSANLPVQSSTA